MLDERIFSKCQHLDVVPDSVCVLVARVSPGRTAERRSRCRFGEDWRGSKSLRAAAVSTVTVSKQVRFQFLLENWKCQVWPSQSGW